MMSLLYLLFFILGVSFGSFLNALEWRMYHKMSLFKGRSMCTQCKQPIVWYDNIPVVSYFLLRGKCRGCASTISMQYPVVELVMGLLFVIVLWWYSGGTDIAWMFVVRDIFITWVLAFIFIYDLKYMEVSDVVTLGASSIFFIVNGVMGWIGWGDMLIGAGVVGGFFALLFFISRGRWIGGGDMRIGIFMGIVLGWQLALLALWFAYIVGAVVSVLLIILKKKALADETPFGTYLSLATFVVLFWGGQVLSWYLSLLS